MKIKELFTDKSKWTKHTNAKDRYNNMVSSSSSEAVCWCLLGAVAKCYPPGSEGRIYPLITHELVIKRGHLGITVFNDAPETTFEQVKELVEKLDI